MESLVFLVFHVRILRCFKIEKGDVLIKDWNKEENG